VSAISNDIPQAGVEARSASSILKGVISNEEIEDLRKVDDLRSGLAIFVNFSFIAGWMALVAIWPNPITILLALFGIGARQLGFAVLMHEAAHHTLFSNRKFNDWAGNWLAGYPVWSDAGPYRRYHLIHHAHTGTQKDPDLSLSAPFPATRKSLMRKIWRDLSGQTGFKQSKQTAFRDLGIGSKKSQRNQGLKTGEKPDVGWQKIAPFALWNVVFLALCWAAGHPAVYLLYPIAFLTTYRLVIRIRSIAEHAMAGPAEDPLRNTRTTLPSWWERIFIAPLGINYHLEHHFIMTVPWYNLPRMHALLQERGLMKNALVTHGYVEVLRQAGARSAA
jgi:fatty acid desaturase